MEQKEAEERQSIEQIKTQQKQVWWVWSSAGVVGVVQCRCGGCGPMQVWWVWSSVGVVGVVQCRCGGCGPM